MMNRIPLLLPALCLASFCQSFAQCSDAGACAIGHRTPETPSHRIAVGYEFGRSGKAGDLTFHSIEISADVAILPKSRLIASIPYTSISGPLGNTAGIGDLTVVWSQEIYSENNDALSLQAGVKLATADVNAGNLVQSYQSGLGTTDFLAGIQYGTGEWNLAVAYLHSPGRSANALTRLGRGDDILIRGGYSRKFDETSVAGEFIAIKRLRNSTVLTSPAGQPETFGTVPGSDQAQINLVARILTPLAERLAFTSFVAIPMLKREVNVDGLTRSLVVSAGIVLSL